MGPEKEWITTGGRSPKAAGPFGAADTGASELGEEGVLGVALPDRGAAVEDRGLAGLDGECQVASQVCQLVRDRAEDPVVVQARLTDRDHALVAGPGHDLRPGGVVGLGRVMRMDADRRIEPGEALDKVQGTTTRGEIPARDKDALDARQTSSPEYLIGVALEAVGVEVAVRVDQAHRGMVGGAPPRGSAGPSVSRSRRGKSGSGAVTRPGSPALAPQASCSRIGGPPFPSAP